MAMLFHSDTIANGFPLEPAISTNRAFGQPLVDVNHASGSVVPAVQRCALDDVVSPVAIALVSTFLLDALPQFGTSNKALIEGIPAAARPSEMNHAVPCSCASS